MNLQQFLDHWRLTENPFRGEEARQDPVFQRLEARAHARPAAPAPSDTAPDRSSPPSATDERPAISATAHSEFEKIAGDFSRPSTSIVFGEKGSGKTAIRMQLLDRVIAHNLANPSKRCLWISYDDWNPMLGRFLERVVNERKPNTAEALSRFRLVDHIDAVLLQVIPELIDAVLEQPRAGAAISLPEDARRTARRWPLALRQDLIVLQSVYDRWSEPGGAERRTRRLRRALRLPPPLRTIIWSALAFLGWLPAAGVAYYAWTTNQLNFDPSQFARTDSTLFVIAGLLAVYLVILLKRSVYDRLRWITLGHRIRRQLRSSPRSDPSYGRSLRQLDSALIDPAALPMTNADETRSAMLERLRRVLEDFGYSSAMIVIDRVDEPSAIAGDPERMRSVVWPLLSNKFLQQSWLSVKMLLPMELRHILFRESAAFFQEARLDKQNMIERLSWTGTTLYDLCNARLQACLARATASGSPSQGHSIMLLDLFAEDVTRHDLIEALENMQQPRDAFKLLYACMVEHCASVHGDQPQHRIPRLTLETVRKNQVERVRQLSRGVRPA
jgi:hypothetical protein